MSALRSVACTVWKRMHHRKIVNIEDTSTRLQRCLTLKRLTFIGVGKTVGVGIYVLIGVATEDAGPSIILSFLVAFLVTLLNGLCFAEFASKNPKTGAQYSYMYETIGEAVAFIIGWTTVISITAAMSMAARGWSGYVDSLSGHAIKNYTVNHIANWTSHGTPFPEYPDLMAILIVLVVMVIGSVGVNCSSIINSILTAIAAGLLIFITIVGLFYANIDNWTKVPGGFFPHGLNGVLKASSSCFYAFQGYEILGLSAEETVHPKKDIPRAIISVLVIVTMLYLSVAVSFTLMIPYTEVNVNAPFPGAFEANSVTWAKYIVEIGPILALTNLVILELFTLQRLVFSISEDGLLFQYLSKVNAHTKVPIGPVVTFCPIVILLLLCIDLSNLIGFMVSYSFVQYALFGAYMIILRYEPEYSKNYSTAAADESTCNHIEGKINSLERSKFAKFLSVKKLVVFILCVLFILSLLIVIKGDAIFEGNVVIIVVVGLLALMVTIATVVISCRNQEGNLEGFLVPLMPVVPVLTIFTNLLMLVSAAETGTVLASVSLAAIGVCVYLCIVIFDAVKTYRNKSFTVGSHDKDDQVRLLESEEMESF